MVDTAGVLGMAGSIRSGGRRAAIATTALALAISVGAVGAVASSAVTSVAAAAPTECHGVEATIVGTPGDDHLVGTSGKDVVVAGMGDDVVVGNGGHDVICGRAGDDVLRGGKGGDTLRGGDGNDRHLGGAGKDQLRGGENDDTLRGGAGDDALDGGPDTDDCEGGSGFNTVVHCEVTTNQAPTATDDTPTTNEDSALDVDVLGNDTDPDGDDLLVTAVNTTGTKGTVTIVGGGAQVRYNPNGQFESLGAGASGADTFGYTVADGQGGFDAATVTVTVTGLDDPPARWPTPPPWPRTPGPPPSTCGPTTPTSTAARRRSPRHPAGQRHRGDHQRRERPDLRVGRRLLQRRRARPTTSPTPSTAARPRR